MPTRASVERHRTENAGVVALARRDLNDFFASLNLSRPELARDALLEFIPALTDRYGAMASEVAADWYDELREAARIRSRFTVDPSDPVPADVVQEAVRYNAGHLFTDAPSAMLDAVAVNLAKYVLQPGRDTMADNAARDPGRPAWARVPSGSRPCAWCLVLASRGAVYESALTASQRKDGRTYHGECMCVPTLIYRGQQMPEGYDPAALYEMYDAAVGEAGGTDMRSITAAVRRKFPDAVSDGVKGDDNT